MQVLEVWRHPVKSMQGERLDEALVEASGLAGDRDWGIRDSATGRVLTARREPPLLMASARTTDASVVEMTLPGGQVVTGPGPATDAALSEWLGRPVRLDDARAEGAGVAEAFEDATDDTSPIHAFTMPEGRFVDVAPVLLLTMASLRAGARQHPGGTWDVRRFRPNLLIDADGEGWVEDEWCGRVVRVGAVELLPLAGCVRCTMITRPQPGLERDLDIYRSVAREHGGTFGVWAEVRTPGVVRVGDPVTVTPA